MDLRHNIILNMSLKVITIKSVLSLHYVRSAILWVMFCIVLYHFLVCFITFYCTLSLSTLWQIDMYAQ